MKISRLMTFALLVSLLLPASSLMAKNRKKHQRGDDISRAQRAELKAKRADYRVKMSKATDAKSKQAVRDAWDKDVLDTKKKFRAQRAQRKADRAKTATQ